MCETYNSDSYAWTLPPSFFPFVSNDLAVQNLIESILFRRGSRDSISEVSFVGMERKRICDECGYEMWSSILIVGVPWTVMLHILHHGSVIVKVVDLKRNVCGQLIACDVVNDALFWTKKGTSCHKWVIGRLDIGYMWNSRDISWCLLFLVI